MSLAAKKRKIHFIGIGGIGMSGIAELLLRLGHHVSGSDLSRSESVQHLERLGATVFAEHASENIQKSKPDVVVYSTAIASNNPELAYSRQHNIPIIRRAEMLAELMHLKRGVALAGSHGKTTSTGLLSLIVKEAGLDPTIVIGGRFDAIGSNAAWGGGQWIIAEADESDGSFLRLSPEIAVVTNIDREHLDHYRDFGATMRAFEDFLDRLPFYGRAILCSDCSNLRSLEPKLSKPRLWYGFDQSQRPDYWVRILTEAATSSFEIYEAKDGYTKAWLSLKLDVPGRHNILNASAAALAAFEMGVDKENIQKGLLKFRGVRRRFELKGYWKGHPVIEDYAHHPTEINATLQAAKAAYGKLQPLVIFQPHRYSRTRDLWFEFKSCFELAAQVFTLPIYPASEAAEEWTKQFDGPKFCENIDHAEKSYYNSLDAIVNALEDGDKRIQEKAPILILGAGDISKLCGKLTGN